MNLTKNFTLEELTASSTAKSLKIDNTPDKAAEAKLKLLCEKILQPLRDAWGKTIVVTSGYRGPALNAKVGGSKTSQHMTGEAADIQTVENTPQENKKLLELIKKLNLPFDQLIWEYGTDAGPKWVHVSYGPRNRKQFLRIK